MKKATIKILEGKLKNNTIKVMFNPSDYSIDKKVTYKGLYTNSSTNNTLQYTSISPRTLKFTLVFDTYMKINTDISLKSLKDLKQLFQDRAKEDVRVYTSVIEALTKYDDTISKTPKILFKWGTFEFKGVIVGLNQKFTMFLGNGLPVRAKLTIEMLGNDNQEVGEDDKKNIKKIKEKAKKKKKKNPRKILK